MSGWTMDYRPDHQGADWSMVEEKPSADALKTAAKKYQRKGVVGSFRIFAPDGRLYFLTHTIEGVENRISWRWANFETREQLAQREAAWLPSGR